MDDIDLNFEDFVNKVNSDLVGKVVNMASRTAGFVEADRPFGRRIRTMAACSRRRPHDGEAIAEAYEECDFSRAMRLMMAAADRANKYIETASPGNSPRSRPGPAEPAAAGRMHDRPEPVPPVGRLLVARVAAAWPSRPANCSSDPIARWEQSQTAVAGHGRSASFEHMMQRVDPRRSRR